MSVFFKKMLSVGMFQAMSQAVNAATGFIIIRTLSKNDYAAYALFFSVLSVISMVSGIGINMGMSVIGGRIWQDRARLGELVNTLASLRLVMFKWMLLPFAAYVFWLFAQNGIGWSLAAFSLAAVLAVVWLQIPANLKFDVAKLLHRTDIINRYELVPALVRLAFVGAALAFFPQYLWPVLLATVISYVVQYVQIDRQAVGLFEKTGATNPAYRAEVVSLMKPDIVNTLYFVFQGQVTIVLLSLFTGVSSIAEVTALGRLMVIFAIINSTLTSVLMPVFAKEQSLDRLRSLFFRSSLAYLGVLLVMIAAAYFFPDALLWVLGEKYAHLRAELFVMVLGACFMQYVGFMWQFVSSKGWVKYHWLYTPFTLINQIVLFFTIDLNSQMGIIWFGALSGLGFFLVNCISLFMGFSGRSAKPGF